VHVQKWLLVSFCSNFWHHRAIGRPKFPKREGCFVEWYEYLCHIAYCLVNEPLNGHVILLVSNVCPWLRHAWYDILVTTNKVHSIGSKYTFIESYSHQLELAVHLPTVMYTMYSIVLGMFIVSAYPWRDGQAELIWESGCTLSIAYTQVTSGNSRPSLCRKRTFKQKCLQLASERTVFIMSWSSVGSSFQGLGSSMWKAHFAELESGGERYRWVYIERYDLVSCLSESFFVYMITMLVDDSDLVLIL